MASIQRLFSRSIRIWEQSLKQKNTVQLAFHICGFRVCGFSHGLKYLGEKNAQLHLYQTCTGFFFLSFFPKQYGITTIYVAFTLHQILLIIQKEFRVYRWMCVGYMQILHISFISGTGASSDFGICRRSWNQSPINTKG